MEDEEIHKKRNWFATVISIAAIVFIGFFVWRVVYFAGLLENGEFDISQFSFSERSTTNLKLASKPIEGNIENIYSTEAPSLGSSSTTVQIIEFADFGCPYSKDASFTLRELSQKYPNKINYVYRDFPIVEIHPIAQKAAEAGRCAQDQGRFWEYHDKMYQNQTRLDEEGLVEFAKQINLNIGVFKSCLESNRHTQTVLDDYADGAKAGVIATPTFFINGNMITGAIPKNILEEIVNSFDESSEL